MDKITEAKKGQNRPKTVKIDFPPLTEKRSKMMFCNCFDSFSMH